MACLLVGEILTSCGTDLEPEVFPNRSIDEIEAYPLTVASSPSEFRRIFVSDKEVYYYTWEMGNQLIACNFTDGQKRDVAISVTEEELTNLQNLLNAGNGELGGTCWYKGKGYVVGWEKTYIYNPETSEWSVVSNDCRDIINYMDKGTSNVVVRGSDMIQISSRRIFSFSLDSYRWTYQPITHDFMYNGSASLICDGSNLYAINDSESILYIYEEATNLWKEKESFLNNDFFGSPARILVDGNVFYLISSNSSFARQWDSSNNAVTLLNMESLYSHSYTYSSDLTEMFNVKSIGYILGYDGSMTYLMKFNLK